MRRNPAAVVGNINGRIRLAFSRRQADDAPETTSVASEAASIDVIAYAEDCILSGRLPMGAERLSDLLNDNYEFEFADVMVEDLVGNDPVEVRDTLVHRDELMLVQATGPRGHPGRRNHTRQHLIIATIGPYDVRGFIHTLPGSDPIEGIRRRRSMIALTDAIIEFDIGTTHHRREAEVVILNRDCVDTITDASEGKPVRRDRTTDQSAQLQ